MIIGLTGLARSGKSTAASILTECGFDEFSFASPIRNFVCELLGLYSLEELDVLKEVPNRILGGKTPREFMRLLGTEFGRDMIYSEMWVESCLHRIQEKRDVVISDIRFENEAHAVMSRGGIILSIVRTSILPPASKKSWFKKKESIHRSEMGIPQKYISHVVMNDGSIEDLKKQLSQILLKVGAVHE